MMGVMWILPGRVTMMTYCVSLAFLLLPQIWNQGIAASQISCSDDHLENCIKQFKTYLNSGVEILKDANDTFIGQVCGTYLITSECLAVFMYYCPAVKKQLQSTVREFDFACNAEDHSGNWPYMPTVSPEGSSREDEEFAAKEKANLIDSAIKASIAAAVTILLILVCVVAECASKWRIRQRIKKAAAQADQPLLKSVENETADASGEQMIKKE